MIYSQSDLLLSLTITVPRLLIKQKSIVQLKVGNSLIKELTYIQDKESLGMENGRLATQAIKKQNLLKY